MQVRGIHGIITRMDVAFKEEGGGSLAGGERNTKGTGSEGEASLEV